MAVSPLLHQSHEVLDTEHCSGYIDQFGKWNTGFPCPWLDVSTPGLCCGTANYKYCCSGKLKIATAPPPSPEDPLLLVLAITLGVAAGITLLILIACFVCPGCLLHKKRRPGPLYRLPCSSTMSTYVPAAMTTTSPAGTSSQQHPHRPTAIGFNDIRASTSFQSFNGAINENGLGGGGVSSLYSLTDTHCPVSAESNNTNGDHLTTNHRGQEMNRACHHLYWSRPLPRMPSVNGDSPAITNLPVRMSSNNQGSGHRHQDDPSPPPPYEADFNHRHHHLSVMNNRAQLRQHLQQLQQAESVAFRQQQQLSSNISPRQPALCIIEDGRRDNPQLTYHSTKF